ncbi:MAG: hypothetical protein ACR2HN_06475 [Tepidiformaceae bacterium]
MIAETRNRRLAALAVLTLGAIVVAVGSFFAAQRWAGSEFVTAGPGIEPEPTAQLEPDQAAATPAEPTALPDEPTSFPPNWDMPYLEADRLKPRYHQVINGIAVGPGAPGDNGFCTRGSARWVDPEKARGTPVWFEPGYLPADALEGGVPRRLEAQAVECSGGIGVLEVRFGRAAAPEVTERLERGESWFDIPTGGFILITRTRGWGPAAPADLAADRWYAATINGLPAAVGRPILDRGLGDGIVVTWDAERNVTTMIRGLNLSIAELLKVAEGLK